MFTYNGPVCGHQILNIYSSLGILLPNQLKDIKKKSQIRTNHLKIVSKIIDDSILGNDVGSIVNDYYLDLLWTSKKKIYIRSLSDVLYEVNVSCWLLSRKQIIIGKHDFIGLTESYRLPPCKDKHQFAINIISNRLNLKY